MSDISEHQMSEFLAAMQKSAGSLGKIADKFGGGSSGRAKAVDQVSKDLSTARKDDTKSLKEHWQTVKDATHSADAFTKTITRAAEGFAGGWIFKELVHYGSENVKVYQELTNSGQNFGGSMLKMSQQAAAAGMPLEMFARIIKQNNVVVGQMGTDAFFRLNKSIRQNIESAGMYGMTMEDLGNFTAEYMDIQRLAGKNIKAMASPGTERDIADFAANITAVSDVLGANRDQVMKMTMDQMKEGTVAATLQMNSLNGLDAYNKGIMTAVASLNAQSGNGEIGKALAQTFGSSMGAVGSELGKTLIGAGQTGLVGVLDEANQRIKSGENAQTVAMDAANKFKAALSDPETLESLKNLAAGNNASAESILAMGAQLKTYTQADIDAQKKQIQRASLFTAFFASFQSIFDGIKGAFLDGFLKPFVDASGQLDAKKVKSFWDTIQNIEGPAKSLGLAMGTMVKSVFTPANIEMMLGVIKGMIRAAETTAGVIATITNGLGKTLSFVDQMFTTLFGKKTGGIATAIAAFTAFFAGKKLLDMVAGGLMRAIFGGVKDVVTVKGRIVNVEGAGGGRGGGGGGPANDNKKGPSEREIRAAERRRANALKRGARRGLVGEELEAYATKHERGLLARGRGLVGRQLTRVPGAARVAGLGGRLGGAAETALSHPLGRLATGDISGAMTGAAERYGSNLGRLAPALGFAGKAIGVGGVVLDGAIAAKGAWDAIQKINALVKAGKITPEQGQAEIKKVKSSKAGQALGSMGGSAVGAAIGTALIPIPVVGTLVGSAVGGFVGGKAGEMLGGALGNAIAGPDPKSLPKTAAPKGQAPAAKAAGVEVIDDNVRADLTTAAMMGTANKSMLDELKKINDKLALHTAVLASTQKQQLDAQARSNNNLKNYTAAGT